MNYYLTIKNYEKMEILRVTGQVSIRAAIEKSIGSIVIISSRPFEDLVDEQIRIYIERNGADNIEITKGLVSLKKFILCSTYGDDAIGSFRAGIDEEFNTVAVVELCEHGGIRLDNNDKIKFELTNLNVDSAYIIDGIEEPVSSLEVYTYEEKILTVTEKVCDVNVENFDVMTYDDDASITELQYHYDEGQACNYTRRELRAMSQDNDPIAYVKKNGLVVNSFVGVLQLPLKGVKKVTFKKSANAVVSLLMRHDQDLKTIKPV